MKKTYWQKRGSPVKRKEGPTISKRMVFSLFMVLIAYLFATQKSEAAAPVIASKSFTESYVLSEILAQKVEGDLEIPVIRRSGMGGTGILFEALKAKAIDVYPEYSGTISESLLKNPALKNLDEISKGLEPMGLVISKSLGFNNTYALAVTRKFSASRGIKTISDLVKLGPSVRYGLSHEFVSREDGMPLLRRRYGMTSATPQSMEHSLSYEALAAGSIDVVDAYSTDAKIVKLDLVVLKDDLEIFPKYEAVLLARKEFAEGQPQVWSKLREFEGKLTEDDMIRLNAELDIDRKQPAEIAAAYLKQAATKSGTAAVAGVAEVGSTSNLTSTLTLTSNPTLTLAARIWSRTKEHLVLVGLALAFSILVGIPLGLLAIYQRHLGQGILLLSGLVQTIPSLAVLCFLIPFFGIGLKPSLIALCLYGLLPIVVGTFVGIRSIDPTLIETARALGLSTRRRILQIELPLASRNILAGIRTSAVVGIGMATLAALIGGGGYGAPILMGLATNNMDTILMGAIPASVMAVIVHISFLGLEALLIPKGLKD